MLTPRLSISLLATLATAVTTLALPPQQLPLRLVPAHAPAPGQPDRTAPGSHSRLEPTAAQAVPVATADVIILGAGVSGIAAATELIKRNVSDILVLEARPEVGGRAYRESLTDPETGRTLYIEKGGNWIQGHGREQIAALADKWGLQTVQQNYGKRDFFDGKWSIDEDEDAPGPRGRWLEEGDEVLSFMSDFDDAMDRVRKYAKRRIKSEQVDISTRAGFSIKDWLPRSPLEKVYEWFHTDFTYAQPPELCSLHNTFSFSEEPEHDRLVVDQRGFKYIYEQELREALGTQDLTSDPRLRLNTTVSNIDYSADSPRIHTDRGTFVARKHVIVTFSIGVLQDNRVTWTPRLPNWKKEAIYTFGMALYQKIFLLFPRKFWRDTQFQLYADPEERGRYPLWQNLNHEGFFDGPSQGWATFVTNVDAEARRVGAMPDAEVKQEVMLKLREMYGDDIPEPLAMVIPRWDQDPLFRGSYSNWPLGQLDQHHSNLRQSVGNNAVFFTGEANSVGMFGYYQGAWSEGLHTGRVVSRCVNSARCPPHIVYEHIHTCEQDPIIRRSHLSSQPEDL